MRIALLMGLLAAGGLHAEMVSYTFTGTLATASDPAHLAPFSAPPGTSYSLTATFDRAAAPISVFITEYRWALQQATLTVGSYTLNANVVDTANNWFLVDHSPSFSDAVAIRLSKPGEYDYQLDLREFTGTLFTGPPTPPTAIDPSLYDYRGFDARFQGTDGEEAQFTGSVSTMPAASTTPEPGGFALLVTGLLGLAAARRRRRTPVSSDAPC